MDLSVLLLLINSHLLGERCSTKQCILSVPVRVHRYFRLLIRSKRLLGSCQKTVTEETPLGASSLVRSNCQATNLPSIEFHQPGQSDSATSISQRLSQEEREKMNETNKFCCISEELLATIVRALDDISSEEWQETRLRAFLAYRKSLRLVSRRFARSHFIRSTLFKCIQLLPGPDELGALTQIKINDLAPFVKTVAFVAPPYSWTLTFEDFRKSTLAQAIEREGIHSNNLYTYVPVKMVPRLHRRGRHRPFHRNSDQEMSARYQQYRAHALSAKSLLQGEELRAAWTSALKALPHVEEVVIRSPRLVYQDRFYKAAAGPVGDALFTAAVAVLSAAGLTIRNLRVVGLVTGCLDWETLPGWESLDLGQLKSFTFRPRVWRPVENLGTFGIEGSRASGSDPTGNEVSEDEESCEEDEWSSGHGDSSEDDEPHKAEAMANQRNTRSESVAAVLKKSADSIEKFKYSYLHAMHWPGAVAIPLPKLRYLSLRGYGIYPRNLAIWMAEMPSLNHLKLSYSSIGLFTQPHYLDWRYVFDAIRNHPKPTGMKVHLFKVNAYDYLSFDCDTNNTEQYERSVRDLEDVEAVHDDLPWSLALYLSGKIEYNRCLEVCLEGYD